MTVSSTSLMDGINRHVLAIASGLSRLSDVEVGVVTLHPWGAFNDALKQAGVKCWSLGCANGHQLKVLPRFCRVMREFHPNVIHSHVMAFFESVAHKWLFSKVKLVVTVHGISDPTAKVSFRVLLWKWLCLKWLCRSLSVKAADAQIYISRGVMGACPGGDVRSFVIYNPMRFDNVRYSSHEALRIIGTACRVDEVKNPLSFVRVMGEVTQRMPHVEAWIVGDGPTLDACKQLAQGRGYDNIKFWGSRNDAKDLIAKMDCFIMTSKREGMPGSLLEAMSVKTPIAFMKGEGGLQDLAEMNDNEGPFAVVVEQGDEKGMVGGICDLLNDPAKHEEYAERAHAVGKRHFDLNRVVEELLKVYQGVLAK